MSWFKRAPVVADNNPASAGYMIPPDESPAWLGISNAFSGNANMFLVEGDAWAASAATLPDPTTGGYVERADSLGWSDGLGKAFNVGGQFDGAILDPHVDPLNANWGGNVGLSTHNVTLGSRVASMYYPDNATPEQVAVDYAQYFGG